ncbi:hypothetical protein pb186bvf_015116 [Paramecium bursaria]
MKIILQQKTYNNLLLYYNYTMSEHIGDLKEQTVIQPEKGKRYRSRHPGDLPPSYSTFNNKNTNVYQNNIAGENILHRGYFKHAALWGKPKFETHDSFPFPTGVVKPNQCDVKKPPIQKHYKYKADTIQYKQYLESKPKRPQTAPIKPKEYNYFGKVPSYLEKMKAEREQKKQEEEEKKKPKTDNKPTQKEIYALNQALLQKKEALLKELGKYTHKRDFTEVTKKKKENIEQQIKGIENDIKRLERFKF